MDPLEALSSVDGRYRRHTKPLADIMGEKGLFQHRTQVENEYLLALSKHPDIGVREFSDEEQNMLKELYTDFSVDDARLCKRIETKGYETIKKTNHDVKAVEYFIKLNLQDTSLEDSLEWVHFALTSEDVNNLAYGLMLSKSVGGIILPKLNEVYDALEYLSLEHKDTVMLARTHGQDASPTTFGKEFKVFSSRLKRKIDQLEDFEILAKLNGATGNYNAHLVAYPEVDWPAFSEKFITEFNSNLPMRLTPNLITTQIEPHDTYVELFNKIHGVNSILTDLSQDVWRYISDDWIKQKPNDDTGSSTMPHKTNPIDFENSEGNFGIGNALFEYFNRKLPISRLQRDLSDSTVERAIGMALGHGLIGYNKILSGLSKIIVDVNHVESVVEESPQVISEAIQTVLRREGVEKPYELLKDFTRGKQVTIGDFEGFIEGLNVSIEVKDELHQITPRNYIGLARKIVEAY